MKWLPLLALLFLASCSNNKEQEQSVNHHLGKYVYRDDNDIHHINPNCIKLRHGKDDNGHEIYAKHMMDTTMFVIVNPQYFRVCARCVNEEEYEHLLRISNNNSMTEDSVVVSNKW